MEIEKKIGKKRLIGLKKRIIANKEIAKKLQTGWGEKKQTLSSEIPFINYLAGAIGLNLFLIFAVIFAQDLLPPEVPLLYGLPEGEKQLAASSLLTIPSALSLLIIFVNTTFSLFIKNDFIKKVLIASGIVITFFSTITTLKIFFLVGNI